MQNNLRNFGKRALKLLPGVLQAAGILPRGAHLVEWTVSAGFKLGQWTGVFLLAGHRCHKGHWHMDIRTGKLGRTDDYGFTANVDSRARFITRAEMAEAKAKLEELEAKVAEAESKGKSSLADLIESEIEEGRL